MKGTKDALQRELEERGRIIVACSQAYEPGTIWEFFETSRGTRIDGPVVVGKPSTSEEFWDQANRLGLTGRTPADYTHFYEVHAE